MSEPVTLRDVLVERLAAHQEAIAARARGEKPKNFIPTGITSWDRNGGLETGVMTIIAGPTGEGKSAVMLHLVRNAAEAGIRSLVLSFEDPAGKTADRVFARSTGESGHVLGRMDYDPAILERLAAAVKESAGWASLVEFRAGLVTAKAAYETVKAADAKLIVIDYAQAFPDDEGSRERMLAALAWSLSELAQQKQCAVVLFSQVRSEVEERGKMVYDRTGTIDGYRPGPGAGDVGWSRAMTQRAKVVIYLFRPGRWARGHGLQKKDDTMQLIFAKVNFGVEGTLEVGWDGAHSSIFDRRRT